MLLCVALCARSANTAAAEETPPAQVEPPRFCLDAGAAPECEVVPLFEVGFRMDLEEDRLPWTLSGGLMVNVSRLSGVGVSADLRLGDTFPRWALRARHRFWIGSNMGLDLAAGPSFAKSGLMEGHSKYGASTGIAVDLAGYIALTGDVDFFSLGNRREYSTTFGVRLGPGIVLRALGVGLLQAVSANPRRPGWAGGQK